ncbi:hypothetical protein SJI00_20765 [Pseudomonas sp. RP23018S]|uniref:secretion/conjugation apparatus DotM-related subunit n=1 Tax=Pseudomonas sp. RP23018S TaxID=3096037 RepID=UPI002ACA4987|nr:hypothetical protein [Pseudomonas sp. RP23018S]MDZ5605208.1 hypothetical protein [Pseudomonas sp. RP23018S]
MNHQGNATSSDLIEFGIYLSVTVMLVFGGWYVLRPFIMWFSFLSSFYVFKYAYVHLSFLMTDAEYATLIRSLRNIPAIKPNQYGIEALFKLFQLHGYVWRWPTAALMLYYGWSTRKGVKRFKYRRQIKNVYDLIEIQAKHFPASAIIRGKNLLDTHLYDGPWRTYALPIDFALDEGLLWTHAEGYSGVLDPQAMVDEKRMIPIPPFNKDEKLKEFKYKRSKLPHYRYTALNLIHANKVFGAQLGPIWEGAQSLPPMERGLYAAFCAQAAGDAASAMKLINQMAFSFVEATYDKKWKPITAHHCDITGAADLIEKYGNHPDIRAISERHAHRYNVIYGVLDLARANGRLFHSNFLWLRPVNRTLFILLCSHGGQCPYWEVAGLWSHYQIEFSMRKKILKPMVASAVYAMKDEMSKEHWIDPGEYSEDVQRRMVEDANKTIREANEAANGPVNKTSFNAPHQNTRKQASSQKKKREDDEP